MKDLATSMAEHNRNASVRTWRSNPAHSHFNVARVSRPRLGQLLVEAGVVRADSLHNALNVAVESKQQIGRVLIGLGYIKERDLQAALLAQSLIAEGAVSEQMAIKAVRESSKRGLNIADVLSGLAEDGIKPIADGGLGHLLVSAGIISVSVHEEASQSSQASGVLLGRTLLVTNAITASMLDRALTVLVMLRDNELTNEQAVRILKEMRRSGSGFEDSMTTLRIKVETRGQKRLGELLKLAKLISESESAVGVERSLLEKKMLGETLVSSGLIARTILDDALILQKMVCRSVVTQAQAAALLQRKQKESLSIAQLAADMNIFQGDPETESRITAILLAAGVVTAQEIATSVADFVEYKMSDCKSLLAAGRLAPLTYSACIECLDLIDKNLVSEEKAICAITTCDRNRCSLGIALASLGLAPEAIATEAEEPVCSVKTQVSPKKRFLSAISDWSNYEEFAQLLGLVLLLGVIDGVVTVYGHPSVRTIVYYVSLCALAAGFVKLGDSWKRKQEQRASARKIHLQSGQETKTRLRRFSEKA
jgi:hypothetical protein